MKRDKEKWMDGTMNNRQGRFFKTMKRLMNSRGTPADTILDKAGRPVQQAEQKLAQWRRHFQTVLNVNNTVKEEVVADLEDYSHVETPEVNSDEAVNKL